MSSDDSALPRPADHASAARHHNVRAIRGEQDADPDLPIVPPTAADRERLAKLLYIADHGPRWATARYSQLIADQFHVAEARHRADFVCDANAS